MSSADDDTTPSIKAEASDQAQMAVLGQGQQTNIYGSIENSDIRIVIEHEHKLVDVDIDRPRVLSLEITNYGRTTRQLSLRVEGVPPTVGTINRTTILIAPTEVVPAKLTLLCTATVPQAGERQLLVRATDEKAHVSWVSKEKTVVIPSRPKVRLASFVPPAAKISSSGIYRATVELCNVGNTPLSVSLRYPNRTQIDGNLPEDGAGRVATLDQVSFGGRFENLAPGEPADITVDVRLPAPGLLGRRWHIPILAKVDREDAAPSMELFPLYQHGLLAELPVVAAQVRVQLRGWVRQLSTWAARPVASRRGVLFAAFVAALMIGAVIGLIASPATGSESAPPSASTTSSGPAPTGIDTSFYEALPCSQGTVVVFLEAIDGPNADIVAKYALDREKGRIRLINSNRATGIPELPTNVHASKLTTECPTAGGFAKPSESKRLIWYGPVQPNVGSTICDTLRKQLKPHECVAWPMNK